MATKKLARFRSQFFFTISVCVLLRNFHCHDFVLDIQTTATEFIEFTTRDTVRYIQSLNKLICDALSLLSASAAKMIFYI